MQGQQLVAEMEWYLFIGFPHVIEHLLFVKPLCYAPGILFQLNYLVFWLPFVHIARLVGWRKKTKSGKWWMCSQKADPDFPKHAGFERTECHWRALIVEGFNKDECLGEGTGMWQLNIHRQWLLTALCWWCVFARSVSKLVLEVDWWELKA